MVSTLRRYLKRAWRFVRKHWKAIIVWGMSAGFILVGAFLLWAATLQIPDLSSLQNTKQEQSVKIYDRTGTVLLYDLHDDKQRTIVPLNQISPEIQHAVIAIEDPGFYQHGGIDPKAILRAIVSHLSFGILAAYSGGSTITQQVVKGSLLVNTQTIARKLKEWILAVKMEQVYTKDQILELYLNQVVSYSGNIYGVEEASETFFGKRASDLTTAEAAYLAAMLPAPSYYSPYGSHLDALDSRKNLVLEKEFEHGYLTEDQMKAAEAEKVVFLPQKSSSIQAPHFVFYVEQYLENKYGVDAVQEGGWKVTTTLDADLQAQAQSIVQAGALANVSKFNASNAALVAIDPRDGNILAMVGSRNYFDTEIPGAYNVAATPPGRQPGSTFKPFAYAEAFMKGYTPDTVVFDVPTQFSTTCAWNDLTNGGNCFAPQNYDNEFRGPISFRDALAQSINVPSVKVLYLAGLNDTLELAKSMGISTLGDASQYGLTLVLGGGEVTLLDMTSAYGAFATNGVRYAPISVLKIEDAQGNVIEDNTHPAGTQVLPENIAEEINDVLSDNVAREPLGVNSALAFPDREVAVKTGTTNNYKDAWTIGYTPSFVMGMWAGNNDNTPMTHNVSGLIVGPMWRKVMDYELPKLPVETFSRQEEAPADKPVLNGIWQTPGADGLQHEILYWVDKNNPTGPQPTNPQDDPQYTRWELPVQNWLVSHGYIGNTNQTLTPATTTSTSI
ncbi:MAG TPA: transglycosylase domain-containing protein [Candidatus Paceibacterota bacterium]|nr:transglycosylase domain-containing protein [Candidatus Paceibacterota bacterium]